MKRLLFIIVSLSALCCTSEVSTNAIVPISIDVGNIPVDQRVDTIAVIIKLDEIKKAICEGCQFQIIDSGLFTAIEWPNKEYTKAGSYLFSFAIIIGEYAFPSGLPVGMDFHFKISAKGHEGLPLDVTYDYKTMRHLLDSIDYPIYQGEMLRLHRLMRGAPNYLQNYELRQSPSSNDLRLMIRPEWEKNLKEHRNSLLTFSHFLPSFLYLKVPSSRNEFSLYLVNERGEPL